MKRRTVFRHLAVAATAAWVLPSCISDPKKVSLALNRLRVTSDDEELLGEIADVIIPPTKTPGARATGAHLFTLVMVDDCMSKPDQERYLKGMRLFEDTVTGITGRSFVNASSADKGDVLRAFEEKLDACDEETKTFYKETKRYIIQGYTSSQYFLTEVKPYALVPGPDYQACVPVSGKKVLL
jgi:hypothetical protein